MSRAARTGIRAIMPHARDRTRSGASLLGGGVRAYLAVRAIPARAIRRRRVEAAGADAGGGGFYRLRRPGGVRLGRGVPSHGVGIEKARVAPPGRGPPHTAPTARG